MAFVHYGRKKTNNMAGHFVLGISGNLAMRLSSAGMLSDVYHKNVPYNQTSISDRDRGLRGDQLQNRNNLPPHCYIQISSGKQLRDLPEDLLDLFQKKAITPGGMGLTSLCKNAHLAWENGRKLEKELDSRI